MCTQRRLQHLWPVAECNLSGMIQTNAIQPMKESKIKKASRLIENDTNINNEKETHKLNTLLLQGLKRLYVEWKHKY